MKKHTLSDTRKNREASTDALCRCVQARERALVTSKKPNSSQNILVATVSDSGEIRLFSNKYWSKELVASAGQKVVVEYTPDNPCDPVAVYALTGEIITKAPLIQAAGVKTHGK